MTVEEGWIDNEYYINFTAKTDFTLAGKIYSSFSHAQWAPGCFYRGLRISTRLFASNLTVVRSLNAGHFVNMVHNGIEYGDMQLICEACHLLLIDFKFAMPKEDNLNVQQEDHDE
ncbi:AGAP004676-PA [Anopheles gambiae str. PEST]|uniref:phosphogluconate dehydrogenase (NADP(+)-dependent, decarboxylating) n=1 Tax=Anopheles gambiae TaxID=7165 RepID=Q7QAE3_ANOGA|nr:AGAP004676-PA [Anopheles gambiae str. PEST]